MAYQRKTKDVYKLYYKGEVIDSFDTKKEAREMTFEYNLAYHGGVTFKRGREPL